MANKLYLVNPGECLSSLASAKGFTNVQAVWDSQSAVVKTFCTSPNHLIPGKWVMLPFKEKTVVGKVTGKLHSFVKQTMTVKLRIVVIDKSHAAMQNVQYVLTHEEILSHSTDRQDLPANGLAEKTIPANTTEGNLSVYMDAWTAQPALPMTPAAPATPPAYPPLFQPEHFRDTLDTDYIGSNRSTVVQWDLKIGYLISHNEEDGLKARLENLGFSCLHGLDAAVRAYQQAYLEGVTGYGGNEILVKDSVKSRHDDPP